MRVTLAALFATTLALTSIAQADVEVGPPPPDAASSGGGGGNCAAAPGATEGAAVFVTLGALGLASAAVRRRRARPHTQGE